MIERADLLHKLRTKIAQGRPVIGGGAGTGLSAKCAQAAGLDMIVVYNSGRYRMAGRSSMAGLMPYGDANQIVMDMGGEIIPVVDDDFPVVAGVCGTDPFRSMPRFLRSVRDAGFSGVQNYPTVCLFDGMIRANLEETGLGFDREVEMIAEAHALDLLTMTYVHSDSEARDMCAAGADIIVAHAGLTTSGMIGAKTAWSLDEAIAFVGSIRDAATSVRDDVIVLAHGGPIAEPADVARVLQEVPGVHGFLGASSMERLPTEIAMVSHMQSYLTLGIGG